jgi:hypothetical protein
VSYVNLPESLQKIFSEIDDRLTKVENAPRFTIPVVPVTVTAAVGNGTTITYTANNVFAPGQAVTIAGLGIASGSELNFSIAIVASATYTQFTVTSTVVGVASGTGQAVIYAPTVSGLNENDPLYPHPGDMWINSQSNVLKFLDGFGSSRSVLAPYFAINTTNGSTNQTSLTLFGSNGQYLEANKVYEIEALIQWSVNYSGTTAFSIQLQPSFSGSVNYYNTMHEGNSSMGFSGGYASSPSTTLAVMATSGSTSITGIVKIWGIISTSSTGQYGIALQTSNGASLSSLNYGAGTYLKLTPVSSSRVSNVGAQAPGSFVTQSVY